MRQAPVSKPIPQPSTLTRPYWDAANAGQLRVQRCTACGTLRHYPRLLCDRCYSADYDWKALSGDGTIHSWTVTHHLFHPAFAGELPYTLVTVDLAEGVRALGRWRGPAPRIGMAVKGVMRVRDDGTGELWFELTASPLHSAG